MNLLHEQWTRFFLMMGILFKFQPKGTYLHDKGIWYNPDFTVPRWNAFIEMRENEPTLEEIELSFYLKSLPYKRKVLWFVGNPTEHYGFFFQGAYKPENEGIKEIVSQDSMMSDRMVKFTLHHCENCSMIWGFREAREDVFKLSEKDRCKTTKKNDCWENGFKKPNILIHNAKLAIQPNLGPGK